MRPQEDVRFAPPLVGPGSAPKWEIVVAQHARPVVSGNLYKLPLSTYTIFFCNGQCPALRFATSQTDVAKVPGPH